MMMCSKHTAPCPFPHLCKPFRDSGDTIPVRKSRVSTYLKDFPPSFATCHFVVFFQRWLAPRHFTSCHEGRVLNVNYDRLTFLSAQGILMMSSLGRWSSKSRDCIEVYGLRAEGGIKYHKIAKEVLIWNQFHIEGSTLCSLRQSLRNSTINCIRPSVHPLLRSFGFPAFKFHLLLIGRPWRWSLVSARLRGLANPHHILV